MNYIQRINVNLNLPNNNPMTHYENFSGSTSSAYDEVSPQQQNSTPVSNDSFSDKQNHSTVSSKKSEISVVSNDETTEATVGNLERTLTEDRVSKIDEIISMLSRLTDTEKFLVQLKFPISDKDDCDDNNYDVGSVFDSAGNQKEHNEAITWVNSHLEEDQMTCLKKQEVYADYKSFCLSHNVKYLSTADFGKVMKRAFPNVKARRLGARGQSQYCYSGLRNRNKITSPKLADVGLNCDPSRPSVAGQDKINDIDSVSSNGNLPDLSGLPEYDLNPGIVVDSALVIIDFVKRVGSTKDVASLRQVVEYILLNSQVEMRTPHALRLMPLFQTKKHHADKVLRKIKKEESVSNPGSVLQAPPATTGSPPNHLKRAHKAAMPPSPAPLQMPYGYLQPQYYGGHPMISNGNPIGHNVPLSAQTMMPIISPSYQKAFHPNTFSTPTKDPAIKFLGPSLNSPLLDNNPTTTKRLELSNAIKSLHQNSPSSYSPTVQPQHQQLTPQMSVYNSSPLGCHYREPATTSRRQQHPMVETANYDERDIGSPLQMTGRHYCIEKDQYEENDDFSNYEVLHSHPPKRRIVSSCAINLNLSPMPNHYDVGNTSVNSAVNRQLSCEENVYLDTPGNSPADSLTNRSSNQEHSEDSSRDNTPSNNSGHHYLKESLLAGSNGTFTTKSEYQHPWNRFVYNNDLSYSSGMELHHSGVNNDEFSVSSTTNTGALEHDRRPSTTVPFNFQNI